MSKGALRETTWWSSARPPDAASTPRNAALGLKPGAFAFRLVCNSASKRAAQRGSATFFPAIQDDRKYIFSR